MQAILGVVFHFIGGFASGSFYLPYKKVKGWSWESYWLAGGLFSWLIVPLLAAWLTVPDFMDIIRAAPPSVIGWTFLLGLLWGVGGLTFGLSMRYLGMSLGMSVALGFTSAFGSLVPPIYRDLFAPESGVTFTQMLHSRGGVIVLIGVLVCLVGIAICGRAGMLKEKVLTPEQQKEGVKEFNLTKGLTVATVSGILSACFNFGIEAGRSMAAAAEAHGANPLFRNNVTFVVILWGGLVTNILWCIYLNIKNKSYKDYNNTATPLAANYLFAAVAGATWFLQFFFYGMGESRLGNGSSSWILHMAFIILVSNCWGIALHEWKGVNIRTWRTVFLGIATIILSVLLVGYGNSI
ncbi:L-rhamnose-H+ transport protein [Chitinophaga costaii]|uniref:L-rhamnose-H+ transport protein n=1 Tax=Chitinophaga costaii TaxID=1335309 RepID=A0A1C4FUL8_9BACT|nr:L-rhamnose/proton symporter RhaT [Chitinophaga costaii]PUZ27197.1 L-rhamnose/proton symporter RhaT [Chitinophaga costaii]SCC59211.1 L-rhamnose-H+ transport protein [Chitinophaga costaii]